MSKQKKGHKKLVTACIAATLTNVTLAQETPLLIHATKVFDGQTMQNDMSVLIENGKVVKVDVPSAFSDNTATKIELGDATLMPGFIELHSHLDFHQISPETVLRHGITTIRNVGGVVHQPTGGNGELRNLSSGQIITVPNGYPINKHGEKGIAIPVTSEEQARQTVRDLVSGGAVVIKIALEPGGEIGAPWSSEHHQHHSENQQPEKHAHHAKHQSQAWEMLPEATVKAIVDEAHKLNRKVTAHVGESRGVEIALKAGVDEWAHAPCADIPKSLLKQAVNQGVKMVSTVDTLSKCAGIMSNVKTWSAFGGEILYGAEVAHPDIPYGIDGMELMYLSHVAGLTPIQVLNTTTAKAGQYLNIPLLGTLQPDAPADLIAVKGDALQNFKKLEYPDFVMSGGKVVVNNFNQGN
jgi:imidazolonepropionase-like amidohydrolase